jgi:hypothetical protein
MYERLLDKTISPTFDELITYSGESGALWIELDEYIIETFSVQRQIRFPYGNKYGWSCKYFIKRKHICDIFAENGAFALFFRVNNSQLDVVYDELSEYARNICDNKYPCSEGGWLTYRVREQSHMDDAKKLLFTKLNLKG